MKSRILTCGHNVQKKTNGLGKSNKTSICGLFMQKHNTLLFSILLIILILAFTSKGWGQIAVRGNSSASANAISITIDKPAGVMQGDVMIVTIAKFGDNVTTPSSFGWTLIDARSLGNNRYGAILYKVAGASEPANYVFSLALVARRAVGSIIAFSGVDSVAPFDVTPGIISVSAGASVNVSATSITTVTANSAVVMIGIAAYNTMGAVNFINSNWNTTSPGGLTEITNNNYFGFGNAGAAWATMAVAGPTGTGTAQLSASRNNGGILLALRPSPVCSGLAPATPASNVAFTASCVPMDITWTRGDGNYCAVFMKNTNSGTASPVDGTSYIASSTFQAGDQIGSSGWFCVYNGTGTSASVTNINPGSVYSVHVCEYNCSGSSIMYNTSTGTTNNPNFSTVNYCYYHPTTGINGSSVGECMTLINSPAVYYDDRGPSANYSTNITHGGGIYRTFCPTAPNQAVRATFSTMDINNTDRINIVNGASGSNSLPTLWSGYGTIPAHTTTGGNWSGGVLTSTDVSGCITVRFTSDAAITGAGWVITLDVVPSTNWQPPVNSDCQTAITICNSASIAATSNGPGMASNCPAGCLGAEYYTNWYVWKVTTSGSLLFTIDPAGADDYDFALYKASECSIMGEPVRCSFYSSTNNTGLNAIETDIEESASIGNGLVRSLNVNAGDFYYLMISDYTKSGSGFTLSFGGTCTISCESPMPVELLSFEARCDNNNVALSWTTASETNNDYFTIERSSDVSTWEFVKSVPGAGNSNSTQFYSAVDKDPRGGISYYRLRQIDFDGNSETFNPVAVNCNDEGSHPQISFSPNPFTSELIVNIQNLDFNKASVAIYDVLGKIIYHKNISSDELPDKTFSINLRNLSSGIYMVSFTSEEFTETGRIEKK